MTKIRAQLFFLFFSILLLFSILLFPQCSAEDKKISKENINIRALGEHQEAIEVGEGKVIYDWRIVGNNSMVRFYVKGENGSKIFKSIDNVKTYSGEFSTTDGKYTFVWENNNNTQPIIISYGITYPKDTYEEGTGCYSAMIVVPMILFLILICLSAISSNKKHT